VNITGIPASITKTGYSVYVYVDGNNNENRTGSYTLNGVTKTILDTINVQFQCRHGGHGRLYTGRRRGWRRQLPEVHWTHSQQSLLDRHATAIGAPANPRAPINGIQIVADGSVASTILPGTALPA